MSSIAALQSVFASKYRLVQKLLEGDVVAWSIVGGAVVVIVLWIVVSKAWNYGQAPAASVRDDPVAPKNDEQGGGPAER